jgi:hypothetical protein
MIALSKRLALVTAVLAHAGLLGLAGTAAAAQRTVDFIPQTLRFQAGLDDDVSGARSQHVTLMIKNAGNTASRYPGSVMRVLVNGAPVNANVYGSNGVGGYNLHAPIAPGAQGLVSFSLRLGTLSHCRYVNIQIDADRTYQSGGNVFANDTASMLGVDPTSIRACIPPIVHGITLDERTARDALEVVGPDGEAFDLDAAGDAAALDD